METPPVSPSPTQLTYPVGLPPVRDMLSAVKPAAPPNTFIINNDDNNTLYASILTAYDIAIKSPPTPDQLKEFLGKLYVSIADTLKFSNAEEKVKVAESAIVIVNFLKDQLNPTHGKSFFSEVSEEYLAIQSLNLLVAASKFTQSTKSIIERATKTVALAERTLAEIRASTADPTKTEDYKLKFGLDESTTHYQKVKQTKEIAQQQLNALAHLHRSHIPKALQKELVKLVKISDFTYPDSSPAIHEPHIKALLGGFKTRNPGLVEAAVDNLRRIVDCEGKSLLQCYLDRYNETYGKTALTLDAFKANLLTPSSFSHFRDFFQANRHWHPFVKIR